MVYQLSKYDVIQYVSDISFLIFLCVARSGKHITNVKRGVCPNAEIGKQKNSLREDRAAA